MTTKSVRIARGTQSGLPVGTVMIDDAADGTVAHGAIAEGSVAQAAIATAITDAPTAPLRMTIKPPRFTTTTPGVMRRLPR